jgi:hypothetical protein
MRAGHPQLPEAQPAYDGIEEEQATALIPEGRSHFLSALLHLLEHALNGIVVSDKFCMSRRRSLALTLWDAFQTPLGGAA